MYHKKVKLLKGLYKVTVLAEEVNLKLIDTIEFNSDKWFHISYIANKEDTVKNRATNKNNSNISHKKFTYGNKDVVIVKDKNKSLFMSLQHKRPSYL